MDASISQSPEKDKKMYSSVAASSAAASPNALAILPWQKVVYSKKNRKQKEKVVSGKGDVSDDGFVLQRSLSLHCRPQNVTILCPDSKEEPPATKSK